MRLPLILVMIFSLILTACLGGGGGGAPAALGGAVIKGPVTSATITVYTMNADGSQGTLVAGPVQSDSAGNWTANLSGGGSGPFLVVATGGSYVDEATGVTLNAPTMRSILPNATLGSIPVTPLTDALVHRVQQEALNGVTTLDDVIDQVALGFQTAFGFDPLAVVPTPPMNPASGASIAELQYAALLGAISHMLNNNPALTALNGQSMSDLLAALALDLADLLLDGMHNGQQLQVGGINLPALSIGGLGALNTYANTFLLNNPNFGLANTPVFNYQQITIVNNTGSGGGTLPAAISGKDYTNLELTFRDAAAPGNFPWAVGDQERFTFSSSGMLFLGNAQTNIGMVTDATGANGGYQWTDQSTGLTFKVYVVNAVLHEINVHSAATDAFYGQFELSGGTGTGGGTAGGVGNTGGGTGPAGTATLAGTGTATTGTEFTPIALGQHTTLNLPIVGLTNTYSFTQTDAITGVLTGSTTSLTYTDGVSPQVALLFVDNNGATQSGWIANSGGGISGSVNVGANTVTFTNVVLNGQQGTTTSITVNGTLSFQ